MAKRSKNISLEIFKNLSYNNMENSNKISKIRQHNIKVLTSIARAIKGEAKEQADTIITQYGQGKISQLTTAENMIIRLKKATNEKQLKSAFKQYDKLVDKHKNKEPLSVRLTEKKEQQKKKQFYVSGRIHLIKTTTKTNKKGETKTNT